jgi:hypothetical protein
VPAATLPPSAAPSPPLRCEQLAKLAPLAQPAMLSHEKQNIAMRLGLYQYHLGVAWRLVVFLCTTA